jgi:hypothetical protein
MFHWQAGMQTSDYIPLLASYQKAAGAALSKGQASKAARILKDALRESEEVGELSISLVDAANQLAESLMGQNKFGDAESLYRAVLEVREKMLGTSHPQVVESLQKLAVLQIVSFRAEAAGKKFINVAPAC